MPEIPTLSSVALLRDDVQSGLLRGQVGTVVEQLGPGVYEVEFADPRGRTVATLSLREEELLALRRELGPQVA